MYAASPWSCWVREWGGSTGFIVESPVARVGLGFGHSGVLGFWGLLGFATSWGLGVSAPPADDTAGGVNPLNGVVFDVGGFSNETSPVRCVFRGMIGNGGLG